MKYCLIIISISFSSLVFCQNNKTDLLIRCDDIGMCHSVNMAIEQVLKTGMPVSVSVMPACPWFSEAAEILKKYPNASIGIHVTLNSEWKQYRWGPVSGANAVPSLVDSLGLFFPSRAALFAHNPKPSEVETELRAQIERAIHSGLKIDYLDHHMSAAVQTLELRMILEKLAAEYQLAISRYYGEQEVEGWYFTPPAQKADTMLYKLKNANPGGIKLLVIHTGLDTPEMSALTDLNPFGPKEMSKHRNAELNSFLSPKFQQLLHDPKYRLVNYGILKKEKGIGSLKRPAID